MNVSIRLSDYPYSEIEYEYVYYPNTALYKKLYPYAQIADNKIQIVKTITDVTPIRIGNGTEMFISPKQYNDLLKIFPKRGQ